MIDSANHNRAPRIETARLILRELCESDFDDFARICADEEAMRYLGVGEPLSRYGAWPHVISLIHPENIASIRVAEKIGETLEGETELNGTRVLIYGIELVA